MKRLSGTGGPSCFASAFVARALARVRLSSVSQLSKAEHSQDRNPLKLHSPHNYIVGGGFFSHYTELPLTFAWDAFGIKNGAQSLEEMRTRIWKYRAGKPATESEEVVGCIMLQQPFFFPESEWIPASDWPMQAVQGKTYDTTEPRGAEIWTETQYRLANPVSSLFSLRSD